MRITEAEHQAGIDRHAAEQMAEESLHPWIVEPARPAVPGAEVVFWNEDDPSMSGFAADMEDAMLQIAMMED